jgi:hypothetical protein
MDELLNHLDTNIIKVASGNFSEKCITGIRFYKYADNTGVHWGYLWSDDSMSLAEAMFTNETESGWQTVLFATPVQITAGTTYVASYHTTTGYSYTYDYFANSINNPPLTAILGVYQYGGRGLFPNSFFRNTNYWVDPIFCTGDCPPPPTPTATPTPTPTATPSPTPSPTPTPIPTCIVRVNVGANINIRSSPEPNASVIGILFPNQRIVVSAISTNSWYQFWISDVAHYALSTSFVADSDSCPPLPSLTPSAPSGTNNSGVICVNALLPVESQFLTYCEQFVYNNVRLVDERFRSVFQQTYGRQPTLQEYVGITLGGEWWAIRSERNGLVLEYGTEGLSRAYFEICGNDGCGTVEFLWFLSGYQPWLIGSMGFDITVNELMSEYATWFNGSGNPTNELDQTISLILSPNESSWRDGSIANEPWQWFNRDTSATRQNEGTNSCTQVLLRVISQDFEMYTAAQDFTIRNPEQCS